MKSTEDEADYRHLPQFLVLLGILLITLIMLLLPACANSEQSRVLSGDNQPSARQDTSRGSSCAGAKSENNTDQSAHHDYFSLLGRTSEEASELLGPMDGVSVTAVNAANYSRTEAWYGEIAIEMDANGAICRVSNYVEGWTLAVLEETDAD